MPAASNTASSAWCRPARIAAADASAPGCGRAEISSGEKASRCPPTVSRVAPTSASAAASTRSAARQAWTASESVMAVPLTRLSPSRSPNVTGGEAEVAQGVGPRARAGRRRRSHRRRPPDTEGGVPRRDQVPAGAEGTGHRDARGVLAVEQGRRGRWPMLACARASRGQAGQLGQPDTAGLRPRRQPGPEPHTWLRMVASWKAARRFRRDALAAAPAVAGGDAVHRRPPFRARPAAAPPTPGCGRRPPRPGTTGRPSQTCSNVARSRGGPPRGGLVAGRASGRPHPRWWSAVYRTLTQ